MARCPSCNRFVSVEMGEPDAEIYVESGIVEGSVRLVLLCADCGEELSEANAELSESFDHECDGEYEIGEFEAEAMDRFQDKDRHGKPIKNSRYKRHYYGADVTVTVKCLTCGEEFVVTSNVEQQASSFEEL